MMVAAHLSQSSNLVKREYKLSVTVLHILAARAVDDGGSSLITVFKPSK